jgi:hypothetical protein
MQDGSFTLDVNGQRVISRDDIFYRDKLVDNGNDQNVAPEKWATSTKAAKPTMISDPSPNDGGLLGGLLGGRGLHENGSQPITVILPRHTFDDRVEDASGSAIRFVGIFFW